MFDLIVVVIKNNKNIFIYLCWLSAFVFLIEK